MPNSVKTYLGFDYGKKRIGVAVGQSLLRQATALPLVKQYQGKPDWPTVDELVKTWKPDAFIVGLPLTMDGKDLWITPHVKKFAKQLHSRYQKPSYFVDERLSSRDVKERVYDEGGYKALKNANIDSLVAAALIEQWFAKEKKEV